MLIDGENVVTMSRRLMLVDGALFMTFCVVVQPVPSDQKPSFAGVRLLSRPKLHPFVLNWNGYSQAKAGPSPAQPAPAFARAMIERRSSAHPSVWMSEAWSGVSQAASCSRPLQAPAT